MTLRLPEAMTDRIDAWANVQPDEPQRSEAIRRLIELGLTMEPRAKQPPADRAARAKELAAKAIDHLADPSASADDKVGRKHRLLKGPEEFRDARVDRPKRKK